MDEPLDPDLLLRGYASGVFPMADAHDAPSLYWVEPKRRGILPLKGFNLSRSLAKTLRSERFETTVNHAFEAVVALCAEAADDRPGTWINGHIATAVAALHRRGYAHSIETWQDGKLVGGLYGIRLGRVFFGESMFSRATDASKVALAHLVARMRHGGFTLLDCQFLTPHLASLGAIEISRSAYMSLLSSALSGTGSATGEAGDADFFAFGRDWPVEASPPPPRNTIVSGPVSGWRIVQALAHTS
jgi:leucyl/phenylalanyl-tRNA---protein transferase